MAVDYFPLLVFVVISIVFALIAIGLPSVLGPRRENAQKMEPYESGIIPFHDARRRFPVKYYLVAMLFILFDIEVIFLYPWAVNFKDLGIGGFVEMVLFIFFVVAGLFYVIRKGAREWDR